MSRSHLAIVDPRGEVIGVEVDGGVHILAVLGACKGAAISKLVGDAAMSRDPCDDDRDEEIPSSPSA